MGLWAINEIIHVSEPSIKASISLARHTEVLGPSFMGFGYLPVRTPSYQDERLMGISGFIPFFLLPRIWEARRRLKGLISNGAAVIITPLLGEVGLKLYPTETPVSNSDGLFLP